MILKSLGFFFLLVEPYGESCILHKSRLKPCFDSKQLLIITPRPEVEVSRGRLNPCNFFMWALDWRFFYTAFTNQWKSTM